jgi:hypothetical protein
MRRIGFSTNSGLMPLQRLSLIAVTSLFIFCGAAKAQQHADDTQTVEGCDAQILTGGYGYSFSGFSGPFTVAEPFFGEGRVGAVGLATFDGAGGLIARDTLARSGTSAIRHAGTGMYSVNANCTGHASIDLTSDTPIDLEHLEFDFMIVPGVHGREFSFIVTNQAITDQASCTVPIGAVPDCTPKPTLPVQTGVALSTGDEPCSDASLQGTYRLLSTGTNLNNPLKPVANANVGFRILDGAGRITDAEDTSITNGTMAARAGRTANYIVNPADCTVTAIFDVDSTGQRATFDGVVVAGGREAYWLRTGNFAVTNIFYKKGPGNFVKHSHDTTPPSDSSVDDDSGND